MSCNPLDKCCNPQPSMCVVWTGTLSTDTYLYIDNDSLNTLLEEIDLNINSALRGSRLNIADVTDNDTCSLIDLSSITNRDRKTSRSDYVFVSDLTKQMLRNQCTIKASIDFIYTGNQLTEDFLNLELPNSFKDLVACLNCDNGCDAVYPTTLGSLLEILVGKVLAYENANSKLNCDHCN